MSKVMNYVTKEGLEKMKAELELLESIERPKITQQIAEARDKGDLSENAEYDAAKEAQNTGCKAVNQSSESCQKASGKNT